MEGEIIFNIDVMLAKRKMSLTELADKVGITVTNMSILKTGKAKAIKVSTLAKLCKALGMYVIGVKRRMIDKPDHVDELYTSEDLDKAISDVDVVVTVMPGNKENENLFTLETFRKMRKDTIMINVGRGNLYTEETLKEVLDNKIIAAVSSDVYLKEPLDPNNELWDKPNLVLTPHVAGGYHLYSAIEKFLDLCKENLRRYLNGEELKNIVTIREE